MDNPDLESAQIRQINAAALKEEAQANKLKFEVDQAIAENKLPFFRRSWFIKSLVAGILLFSFLVGYVELIFLPTQEKLRNEADTAAYKLEQREAKFGAEKARLELLLEQAKLENSKARSENKSARVQLEQAKNSITDLKTLIKELEQQPEPNPKIADVKTSVDQQLEAITVTQDIVASQAQKIARIDEEISEVKQESLVRNGWLYLGHFPNDAWGYKNIDIPLNEPATRGKTYSLTHSTNIRSHAPKFSFSGYKFGAILGTLSPGQKIKLKEDPRRVGFSKIWAEVEVLDETEAVE